MVFQSINKKINKLNFKNIQEKLKERAKGFEGDFFTDNTMRTLYATDASVYCEMPNKMLTIRFLPYMIHYSVNENLI